ncbi:MAG: MarR family transcriptional regulator, partial [Gammaproteobacteria bacterium]
ESHRRYPQEAGLSLSDGRCLAAIGSFEPLSVMDLAMRANLTKGQASRAAQSLVDQGFVHKTDSPSDGRGVSLSLTARGRKVWHRTMALIERRNEEIFGCLNAQEQRQLGALLDRLDVRGRWALLKLVGGAPRVGVSARLAKTALAEMSGHDVADIEEIWHALSPPYGDLFQWLEG